MEKVQDNLQIFSMHRNFKLLLYWMQMRRFSKYLLRNVKCFSELISLRIPAIHEAQNTPDFYILSDISIDTRSFKNLRDFF